MNYSEEFEYFWRVYPSRWDRDKSNRIKRRKAPAWEKWQKLDAETRHEILTKAKYIRDFEGTYARDAVTWLNQSGWDDIEFKPDWKPTLPDELLNAFKPVEDKKINLNNERNRQMDLLRRN